MRVAVTGAAGVLGTAAVRSLLDAGHDVTALVRDPARARHLRAVGAEVRRADVLDRGSLAEAFEGVDVVCSLATRIPFGFGATRSSAWHDNDRLRNVGVRNVVETAREAHVRRVVQESVSLVYADHGDDWIDEQSPLDINCANEPACVAESHVQDFQSDVRQGVVLRLGTVVGDDPYTRFRVRGARHGRPVGIGDPDGWVHPLHTGDLGPAVLAAVTAPGGIYNVGARPVRRRELVQAYAEAAGRSSGGFMGPLLRRMTGPRVEPATRSLRVSSELFGARTGWRPRRETFDVTWLDGPPARERVSS